MNGSIRVERMVILMNHDYAHCLDYNERCPQECFRGELVRDIKNYPKMMATWTHFAGTKECYKNKQNNNMGE